MNRDQGRALIIHKICMAILRKRLAQMRVYVNKLKGMNDSELFNEYRRQT